MIEGLRSLHTLYGDCSRECCSRGNPVLDRTTGKTSLPFLSSRFRFHTCWSAAPIPFSSHARAVRNQSHHGCEEKRQNLIAGITGEDRVGNMKFEILEKTELRQD